MDSEQAENLAKILICPKTNKPLVYDDKLKAFVNEEDKIYYKIENGIPILLEEEAKVLNN
ncbi:Trm112 family protein [Rickettsiales bacterium LUAb2]